jgi:hypothetical protein
VSHPSLGLPPRDQSAGYPAAAARLRAARGTVGARALEIALADVRALRERHDEFALRQLLRDTEVVVDLIADAVAADDQAPVRAFADQVAPVYRRRRVPMDDLVALMEGLRRACAAVLGPGELASAERAIDAAIDEFRWYRRLAGDARKKNRLLQAIYKGG